MTTDKELGIAVAEICGWSDFKQAKLQNCIKGVDGQSNYRRVIPDYPNSRDAAIAAVLSRSEEEQEAIVSWLWSRIVRDHQASALLQFLTAPPRLICEALVAVCGKEGNNL